MKDCGTPSRVRLQRREFLAHGTLSMIAGCTASPLALAKALKPVPAAVGGRTERSNDELDSWMRQQLEQGHVPGASLVVIENGRIAHTGAYGWADIGARRPMTLQTLLNIASVTKTITCAALMRLWERRKFALEDDVNRYLPFTVRNPNHPQIPVTFRQLLTHTSSVADGPAYGQSYACGDPTDALGPWLKEYFRAASAPGNAERGFHEWRPGELYSYSNVAFGLLGHLIERLRDAPFADCVREQIFRPLGMTHSRFTLAMLGGGDHATPYTYVPDGNVSAVELRASHWKPPNDTPGPTQVPHCLYGFATPPDGLARTSAEELTRFLLCFMHEGTLDGVRLLRPDTVREILRDQHVTFPKGAKQHAQGLAWFGFPTLGPSWGHSGGDPGVNTLMVFRPGQNRGLVLLTNSGAAPLGVIAQRILGNA